MSDRVLMVTETTYIVRNANGATLGGFLDEQEAIACRDEWQRRYRRCGIEVGVQIYEQKPRELAIPA